MRRPRTGSFPQPCNLCVYTLLGVFQSVAFADFDLVFPLIRLAVSGGGSGGADFGGGRGGSVGGGIGFSFRSARAALDAPFASAKWSL